eukprot:365573-Chlamydomonas_euryale.AAC.15
MSSVRQAAAGDWKHYCRDGSSCGAAAAEGCGTAATVAPVDVRLSMQTYIRPRQRSPVTPLQPNNCSTYATQRVTINWCRKCDLAVRLCLWGLPVMLRAKAFHNKAF